jgi:nucleoside-diphosphate-sugar epimerase
MAFRRFCHAALTGTPIRLFGDGRQSRDFTFVADIVSALRAAGSTERGAGGVYNIGGGARASLNHALALLAEIAGRPLDVRRNGRESGDVLHTGADITRAREDLGFEPATNLASGLRAEFKWTAELASPAARTASRA